MIGWSIVDAYLWHRSTETSLEKRKRTALSNASSFTTVGIGVLSDTWPQRAQCQHQGPCRW